MQKQLLTKQAIQSDLLAVLRKRKALAICLTAVLCVSVIFYILYAILFARGILLLPSKWPFVSPMEIMVLTPCIMLVLTFFLFRYYYAFLYAIKTGRFNVIEEKLSRKEKEMKSYYRRIEKENALYFPCGRIAVGDKAYSHSTVGDGFYIVSLRSSKIPFAVYHTDRYEIRDM